MFIGCGGVAVEVVGIDGFAEVAVAAELEAGDTIDGQAVVAAFGHLQVEDGKAIWSKDRRVEGLEPGEDLTLRYREVGQDRGMLADPGTGRDYQCLGAVCSVVSSHLDSVVKDVPVQRPLAGVDFGASCLGREDMGDDRLLGEHEAAVGLIQGEVVGREGGNRGTAWRVRRL